MIRIPTYKEHIRGKAIFDRYLYLAALVLPFSPQEVIDTDTILCDGIEVTADNFLEISGKKPRKRKKKYKQLLEDYEILEEPKDVEECFYQDRLLASKIIRNTSPRLHQFLYKTSGDCVLSETEPLINKENLRILLTVKMDDLPPDLLTIPKIKKEDKEMLLNHVFRYEAFSRRKEFIALLKDMDVSVCPYCNRQYTFTVSGKNGAVRPQIDHYKAKERYPYLGISLMNLIPSCAQCNQSKSIREEEVLYPYSDEMGYDVRFKTKMKGDFNYLFGERDAIDEFEVELDMGNVDPKLAQKVTHSINIFHLKELYNEHKDYILYLFWKNYVFSEKYLDEICKEFPDIFPLKSDMENLLYLMDITKEAWGKRTLSKLTHDISREIK